MWQWLALLMGGTLAGSVHLDGPRPPTAELKTTSDPFCPRLRSEEVVGNLANVVVHVVGAPATTPPTAHAVLEQVNCRYSPHVSGIVQGQKVDIVNRDATLHNVHTYAGTTTHFCEAQVPGASRFKQERNTVTKVKCDVHPWMTAYVWVGDNSRFAVSDTDGSFVIHDLPFGVWTVQTWHERFGVRSARVLVLPWTVSRVDFRY